MRKVALITIGQSPRHDMAHIWQNINNVEMIEFGVLDGFEEDYIKSNLAPFEEELLVTKLRNGKKIEVSEKEINRLLQEKIYNIEAMVDMIVVLCTGEMKKIKSSKPLLKMNEMLQAYVSMANIMSNVSILIPDEKQYFVMMDKWRNIGINGNVHSLSPYDNIKKHQVLAERISTTNPNLIILDCMGYSKEISEVYEEICGATVIYPQKVLERFFRS